MATGGGKRLTPTQTRAARRVRQARRRRLIRYGGVTAIALVSFIFILGLILPGLPIPQFGGGGSADIFEQGAADAADTQADAANTQAQAAPSEPNPPAQADAAPDLPPVPWGIHADALAAEMYAANLAQGGVVISYNCPDGCPDILAELSGIVDELRGADVKVILMPNPDADAEQISLAATNITQTINVYDEPIIRNFIQAYSTP